MSWSHLVENFRAAKGKPQACFIVGATGQIGRSLLEEALGCGGFHRVITIARQPIFYKGPNSDLLCEMIIPDFEDLHQALIDSSILKNCSYGFCCLGTTRSKAGSKKAFRRIDLDYVVSIASIAKASGCRWFGVISSSGANIKSPFLYMHTKGEMEAAIKTMGFENLCIYKPGFIQCGRRINRRPVSGDAEHETSSEKHSKPYNFFENLCKSSLFNKKYVIIDHGGLGINTKAKSNEASSVQIPKSIENSTELGTIVEDDEDTTHNGSTIRSPIFDEKDSQNEKLGPEKNSFLKYSSFSETQESEKVINVLDHLRETPQTSLSLKDLPKKFYTEYEEVEDVRCLERLTGATIIPILNLISRERASISKETVAKAMILDALESGIASDRYRLKIVSNRAMIDGVRLSGRMS